MSMSTTTTEISPISPECQHCRSRLSALERVTVAQQATLADHERLLCETRTELAAVRAEVAGYAHRVQAADERQAGLLEQVLTTLTGLAAEVRQLRAGAAR